MGKYPSEGSGTCIVSGTGLETTFAVNVLSHHLLIKLLEPVLVKASSPRVIITSSISQSSTLPSPLTLLNSQVSIFSSSQNAYMVLHRYELHLCYSNDPK